MPIAQMGPPTNNSKWQKYLNWIHFHGRVQVVHSYFLYAYRNGFILKLKYKSFQRYDGHAKLAGRIKNILNQFVKIQE